MPASARGKTDRTNTGVAPSAKLCGIGGWLLLIVLALLASCTFGLMIDYLLVVRIVEHSERMPVSLFIFQCVIIVGNLLVFFIFPIILLYLLLSINEAFPYLTQIWALSAPLYLIAVLFVAAVLRARAEFDVGPDAQEILGVPFLWWFVAIFVYLGKSKRVKNTFVRMNQGSDRVLA